MLFGKFRSKSFNRGTVCEPVTTLKKNKVKLIESSCISQPISQGWYGRDAFANVLQMNDTGRYPCPSETLIQLICRPRLPEFKLHMFLCTYVWLLDIISCETVRYRNLSFLISEGIAELSQRT